MTLPWSKGFGPFHLETALFRSRQHQAPVSFKHPGGDLNPQEIFLSLQVQGHTGLLISRAKRVRPGTDFYQ